MTLNDKNLIKYFHDTGLVSMDSAALIAEKFTYKLMAKNKLQLAAGIVCNEYFYLAQGYMRAFAYDTERREVTTAFYPPGEVIFEVSSFFNRTRSKESIQAITDCEGWFISFAQLNELFHTLPEFREFGRSILVKGFAELKIRMLSMITETAEDRYADLLKTNPEIFRYAPLKNIASYLGVTDTSLSRIRKEFSKK